MFYGCLPHIQLILFRFCIQKSKLLNIAHSDDIIVKFHYFDPVRALLSLLDVHFDKTYFVKNAAKKYNKDNQRVYNTPESAHWWNDTQVILCGSLSQFWFYYAIYLNHTFQLCLTGITKKRYWGQFCTCTCSYFL